jgi:hypothetical protein
MTKMSLGAILICSTRFFGSFIAATFKAITDVWNWISFCAFGSAFGHLFWFGVFGAIYETHVKLSFRLYSWDLATGTTGEGSGVGD